MNIKEIIHEYCKKLPWMTKALDKTGNNKENLKNLSEIEQLEN